MKKLFSLLAALLLAAPLGAGAQQLIEIKPPVPVEGTDKIQVLEFFWYGCIHCYNLEPSLESWVKTLPPDVEFRRVPAVFNERWGLDASIYYAMEALGLVDKLHRPLFEAIHKNRLRTDNQQEFSEWLTKQGVDAKKFVETVQSFGVRSKTRRAVQLTVAYRIDGTPAMAVHGRYTIPAQANLFQVVQTAIDRVRKEK